MLDLKLLAKNPGAAAASLARRGHHFDQDRFLQLLSSYRQNDSEMQQLLAQRRNASNKIGELMRAEKLSAEAARAQVEEQLRGVHERIEEAKKHTASHKQALDDFCMALPNFPAEDVPDGGSEEENVELMRWGEPREFSFPVQDHVALGEQCAGLDLSVAARLSGSRFMLLRGPLASLHRALIRFMMEMHVEEHGYEEVYVPYIVDQHCLEGTGQLPKFEEDAFRVGARERAQYLIPSAEVPLTNMLRDTTLQTGKENTPQLPFRYVAHSPCFRREAGSYGRDTRGVIRQHQFEKVELMQFAAAEHSRQALEELTGHAEAVLRRLELPYRKMILCSGDLGFSANYSYDLEVWFPSQKRYREISSCSCCGDFQARRMNARWRTKDGGAAQYLHTLNGSGLAVGRTFAALLENCQQEDGAIHLPAALKGYMQSSGCVVSP